ncbi:protease complex subunit PrcB family protein [Zooshikella harenae]|uniref:Protease complex subunit PrcB family protein n=1 Tax=Zooshikella harenae TaxID=2827238 RepID=A0ABS5Z8E3_9GAMM|nr:protease complex subunit PrcB family protein [Zooshikella harenae]MBU2709560.1 protease complex subunit PrcB family protein [Zooshikella harenae]
MQPIIKGLTASLFCTLLSLSVAQTASADDERNSTESILPIKVIAKGLHSLQYGKRLEAVRNSAKLQELASLFPYGNNASDEVDFSKYVVIGAFMGSKATGGYNIDVVKAVQKETNNRKYIEVSVKSKVPGPSCIVTMAFTQPAKLVLIPADPRTDIVFKENYQVYHCR